MASPGYPDAVEGVCRWREQRYCRRRRRTRLRRSFPGILAALRLATRQMVSMGADYRDVSHPAQRTVAGLRSISCSQRYASRRASWPFPPAWATRRCSTGAPTCRGAGAGSAPRCEGPRSADPQVVAPLAAVTSPLTTPRADRDFLAYSSARSAGLLLDRARAPVEVGRRRASPARGPPPVSRLAGCANRRSQCVRMSSSMPAV
jgi:hypothetical protein